MMLEYDHYKVVKSFVKLGRDLSGIDCVQRYMSMGKLERNEANMLCRLCNVSEWICQTVSVLRGK